MTEEEFQALMEALRRDRRVLYSMNGVRKVLVLVEENGQEIIYLDEPKPSDVVS